MHPIRSTRRGPLLLAAIVGLAYVNTLTCGFVADDYARIVEDPHVRRITEAVRYLNPGFWRREAATSGVAYRPMRPMLSAVDFRLWGMRPWGFHLTNGALHVATVLLMCALLRRLGLGPGAAWLAAALFGLHWANVEAVAWVKNRAVIAAALALCAALAAVRAGRWAPAALAFALALLSHEQAAAGVLWVLVLAVCLGRRGDALRSWPLWAVLALYALLRAAATAGTGAAPLLATAGGPAARVLRTLGTYGLVLGLPVRLELERALAAAGPAALGLAVLGAALLAASRRGRPGVALAGGVMLLLAPVSNVLPVTPAFGRLVAEQRLYMPLIPFCAIAVWACAGRARRVLLLALLALCAARVVDRVFDWRSDLTIYRDAVAQVPGSFKARYNLGDAYVLADRDAAALREYARSLALRPSHGGTRCRYAQTLDRLGRRPQAIAELERVLRSQPPSRAAPFARELLEHLRPTAHP